MVRLLCIGMGRKMFFRTLGNICSKSSPRSAIRRAPFVKSSLFLMSTICQAADHRKLEEQYGYKHLSKQASVGLVNSATTLLTILTASMIEAQESYVQAMEEMLSLIEAKLIASYSNDEISLRIVEIRAEIEETRNTWQAIEMQMTSVANVMNTAAEMAFSVGAQYVGIAANERLSSAQQQFQVAKDRIRQLELEVKLAQVKDISSEQVPSENE